MELSINISTASTPPGTFAPGSFDITPNLILVKALPAAFNTTPALDLYPIPWKYQKKHFAILNLWLLHSIQHKIELYHLLVQIVWSGPASYYRGWIDNQSHRIFSKTHKVLLVVHTGIYFYWVRYPVIMWKEHIGICIIHIRHKVFPGLKLCSKQYLYWRKDPSNTTVSTEPHILGQVQHLPLAGSINISTVSTHTFPGWT